MGWPRMKCGPWFMSHSGSGSSLSTPGSQIIPCTMGSEPDLTLYFYGTAKHKPPPTASYISQRWEYDCDPARLRSSSIFRKAFSTSQAKFTYAYAWLGAKQRPNPARMKEHPVLWHDCKTEQGESGMNQAPGCPSWVLPHFPAVLPHSLPVPRALQKNCFPKIIQRHTASFYWNYHRDQSCHESTSADHWDSNAVPTQGFLSETIPWLEESSVYHSGKQGSLSSLQYF